jgi:nicotinate-nucleotide adenylyltransferase
VQLIAEPRFAPGGAQARLAFFPAAFHPPTVAHTALLEAALEQADGVILTLARELPHKTYKDVPFEDRLRMVLRVADDLPGAGVAVASAGLFIDIAREARELFPEAQISILCGRDAAERALAWDYGGGLPIEAQLEEYSLLVAARGGAWDLPSGLAHLRGKVERLELGSDWSGISATEVRRRIAAGEGWADLVPRGVLELVEKLYS